MCCDLITQLSMKRLCVAILVMISSVVHAQSGDTSTKDLAAKQLSLGIQLLTESPQSANLTISSYSIHAGLMLARIGARGETAAQLDQLLLPHTYSSELLETYRTLNAQIVRTDNQSVVRFANSLWITNQSTLRDEYRAIVKNIFSVEPTTINFQALEHARKTINAWISERTSSLIPELIPQGSLTPETLLVLANALYFKAPWKQEFSTSATRDEDFWLTPTQSVKVSTMHLSGRHAYFENTEWQSIRLGYLDDSYSFLLLVPKQRISSLEIANSIGTKQIQEALRLPQYKRVNLALPRFRVRQSQDLCKVFHKIGLSRIFGTSADFSGIARMPMGISAVQHESIVSIDEKGTEAAAASAFVMARSAPPAAEVPIEVKADHPFAFIIFHTVSESPLFMGIVGDPRGQ